MLQPIRRKAILVFACTALAMLFGSASIASAATDYMLIDSARLASLPTSGTPYAYMKKTADNAIATTSLATATSTSPWLPNYGGRSAETLAAALVYARTGDTRYRDFVIRVNRFIIGSENSESTNGTSSVDKLLATMRQISGYVLASDLVGMDPNLTGSRSGYGSTVWKTWLGALRTKAIGTSSNKTSIVGVNNHATNWGAWASASRIAIDLYLNDTADLAVAVNRLKLYLGEPATGAAWIKSSSFDSSWACIPTGFTGEFIAVNPSSCGADKDGVIVEDASRSTSAFPSWDKAGIDYSFHAYGAQLVAAVLLGRQGYDVWNWGNRALKRIMDRLNRLGVATGNGRSGATHVSWIPRHFYGASYPTLPAQAGNTLGFTDWLFSGTAAPPPPPPPAPSAALIMGSDTAGTVWTALSTDKKRASRFSFTNPTASVTAIRAYIDGRGATTGSQSVRAVIYSDRSGLPSELLASSNAVTITAGQGAQLVTLSFGTPMRLSAGSYWLGLHSAGSSAVARFAATTISSALRYNSDSDSYADGASSSFGTTLVDNKQMSISAIGTKG